MSTDETLALSTCVRLSLRGLCPKCQKGKIYKKPYISTALKPSCPVCNYDLRNSDSADGPAVFLIFILGFALVPAALLLELWLAPPIIVHVILFGIIALGLTLGALRPLKAFVITLQYKYRDTEHLS